MGNDSFKKFLAKVQSDESLKQEFQAASGETGMPVEAVVAFAAGKGYEFKVEDISSELSDQQLDSVAGGIIIINSLPGTPVANQYLKIDGLSTYLSSAGNIFIK